MASINPFTSRRRKLSAGEQDAVIAKIRSEYDKYIVTFHKSLSLKDEFERRLTNAKIESRDMERFLSEEIAAVRSVFEHQKQLEKERLAEEEALRRKARRREQPDFADRVLEQLKSRITSYPRLNIHRDASYEIIHLFGAIEQFEKEYWLPIDRFLAEYGRWALRGENSDFNLLLWRFISPAEDRVPPLLEKYCFLLDSGQSTLNEINHEAQQCIKEAAFLLNDIIWCCRQIIGQGIDGTNIENSLEFVQNIVDDFRIRDLKKR